MNIGIIGNINNYPFLLGEGLRNCGARVMLIVTRPESLHHPVKAGLVDEIPDWIYDASPLGQEAFENQDASIGDALNFALGDADFVILNDIGPSLHNLIDVPSLSLLTGSDLTYYANPDSGAARRTAWSSAFQQSPAGSFHSNRWEQMVVRQRAGIRRSRMVAYPSRGLLPFGDRLLDEIGVGEAQRMFLYYTDTNRVGLSPMPRGGVLKIMNGARLNWVDPMPPGFNDQDHKGTDILLRGLKLFVDRGGAAQLTLVEKGLHVAETRALVAELGLDPHIVWREEMSLADFTGLMAMHHVVADQFGRALPGMVGLSAMALGRPVLARFPLKTLNAMYGERWPVCHAETPEAIADHLGALSSPRRRNALGKAARQFAEQFLSPRAAGEACIERLYGPRLWRRELDERALRRHVAAQAGEIEAKDAELALKANEMAELSATHACEIEAKDAELALRASEMAELSATLEDTRRQVENLSLEGKLLNRQVEDLRAGFDISDQELRSSRVLKSKSDA